MLRPPLILLSLILMLPLPGCTVYGERRVKAFADATGGEGFERAFWLDIKDQDWKDLDRHIASNFAYITPTGRFERAAALEHIQHMQIREYSIGDLETEMNGDTFLVTYTITLRGDVQGKPFPDQAQRRMTVWQHQKSSWVAIVHSVLGPKE